MSEILLYACWCGQTLCLRPQEILDCCMERDPIAKQWKLWEDGEARCPYCVGLTCPYDLDTICDCFMDHPELPIPDDHICEECAKWRFQTPEEVEANGPLPMLGDWDLLL